MRCSGSPTICTAANAPRVLLASIAFRAVLAPLVASLGPASEIALAPLVTELAQRSAR